MRVAMAVAVLGVLCVGLTARQVVRSSETQAKQFVVLQLRVDDKTSARVTVADGGTVRIVIKDTYRIGLRPVSREGGLEVDVLEVLPDPTTGTETSRRLTRMILVTNQAQRFEWAGIPLQVEWIGMKVLPAQTVPLNQAAGAADGQCSMCCVTCGDVSICACGVEAECGSCCCAGCCDITTGPAGDRSACLADRPAVPSGR